jgi:Glycosyl hydrolase family 63 C-terminal domain
VGLIPLFAVEMFDSDVETQLPDFVRGARWFVNHRPDLARLISRWQEPNRGKQVLLSLLRGHRLKCLLRRALDESEFLSSHGVRSLSKYHAKIPFVFFYKGQEYRLEYEPGESTSARFGGNSNWRGPIWMPVNYLLIDSLYEFHRYYGDDFKVEYPVGSGCQATLAEVADGLRNRLASLFMSCKGEHRPFLGSNDLLQSDPHFRDHLLFHEYYHGETGAGLGASHQTGWSGLIALLLFPRDPKSPTGFAINGPSTVSIPLSEDA